MCKSMKQSGFVHANYGCGCNEAKAKKNPQPETQPQPDGQPKTTTEKDVIREAEKYSNAEVPGYNKVFAGTLLLVTLMIVTGGK